MSRSLRPDTAGGGCASTACLEPAIERGGRHAPVPDLVGVDDRLHQPVEALAGQRRHRDQRHAFHLRQLLVGLIAQFADGAGGLFLQVPFVDRDDDGAAFLLDQIGDALVLLLEGVRDVEQHHHDLGKAHRVERVGDRKLLQLLVDAPAAANAGGVVDAEFLPAPVEIDRDGVARGAGLRRGEQALLADQPVDQRRLAGIRPPDDGDADRMRAGRRRPTLRSAAAVRSGSAARSAS